LLKTGVPASSFLKREYARRTGREILNESQCIGVIGDNQPVERPTKLHWLTRRRSHLFTASESIRLLEPQPRTKQSCIYRQGRVSETIFAHAENMIFPDRGRTEILLKA
jgi:hypothetical protein